MPGACVYAQNPKRREKLRKRDWGMTLPQEGYFLPLPFCLWQAHTTIGMKIHIYLQAHTYIFTLFNKLDLSKSKFQKLYNWKFLFLLMQSNHPVCLLEATNASASIIFLQKRNYYWIILVSFLETNPLKLEYYSFMLLKFLLILKKITLTFTVRIYLFLKSSISFIKLPWMVPFL